MRIEYMRLCDLQAAPRNPKVHDIGAIHQSVNRFGFIAPIILNERTGRIVAGHGRLEALIQKRDSGEAPPAQIISGDDGEWQVPVVRGIAFNSDAEAEAYLVADNRLSMLGGWNDAALVDVLKDLSSGPGLDGIGFDNDDLTSLVSLLEPEENRLEHDAHKGNPANHPDCCEPKRCPECGAILP